MVHAHDALAVDHHVPTKLIDIIGRAPHASSAKNQLEVQPPVPNTHDILSSATIPSVSGVQLAIDVRNQGPCKLRLGDVRFRAPGLFERDDHNGHIQVVDLRSVLLQLQQVLPTGKSRQMAMEHKQQDASVKITLTNAVAGSVDQVEGDGTLADEAVHLI